MPPFAESRITWRVSRGCLSSGFVRCLLDHLWERISWCHKIDGIVPGEVAWDMGCVLFLGLSGVRLCCKDFPSNRRYVDGWNLTRFTIMGLVITFILGRDVKEC